jgi:hypothetical protein
LHPPYSPDLALFDSSLFGHLKPQLAGLLFQSPEELLAAVPKSMGQVSLGTLLSVFHEWIAQRKRVIASDGDYFEQDIAR